MYPAGCQLIQYNIEQKTQKFTAINLENESVTSMAVHMASNLAAVGLKSREEDHSASIILYDLVSLKKKKVLNLVDASIKAKVI